MSYVAKKRRSYRVDEDVLDLFGARCDRAAVLVERAIEGLMLHASKMDATEFAVMIDNAATFIDSQNQEAAKLAAKSVVSASEKRAGESKASRQARKKVQ